MSHQKSTLGRITLFLMGTIFCQEAGANLPVFDAFSFAESVKQTFQQIKQNETQLDQYRSMLKNSKKLDSYTWDQASLTMDNLLNAINTLERYKQQSGGMDPYLARYQTVEHYQTSSCLNGSGCSSAQVQALNQQQANASTAQKRANDAMLRGIDKQQASIKADAQHLQALQKQAQDAEGQMQAIQAANQLASAETTQL